MISIQSRKSGSPQRFVIDSFLAAAPPVLPILSYNGSGYVVAGRSCTFPILMEGEAGMNKQNNGNKHNADLPIYF